MATGEHIITYWLCPAEPAQTELLVIIRDLAARFDAPLFEPHLTLNVASPDEKNASAVVKKVVEGQRPYRLAVRGLEYSDEFTKTFFIQFDPDNDLTRFSEDLRRASAAPIDYQLNPHLSLIYKKMDTETKRRLAESLVLPFADVTFDKLKAVICPATIRSSEDVEGWRVVAEHKLTG